MNDLEQIKLSCLRDPVLFCKTFLPHWFPGRIPWLHRGVLAIMTGRADFLLKYGELEKILENFRWPEDPKDHSLGFIPVFEQNASGRLTMRVRTHNAFLLPRGMAKTTLCNAVELWDILYLNTNFTVYISEAAPHAELQLGAVKGELEGNPDIINAFGVQRPERNAPQKWTDRHIETTTGVAVMARGRGGQVRGLLHKSQRPDKIILDDLEDEESVLTSEQRDKTLRFVYSGVLPALKRDGTSRVFALGTLLHSEAFLARVQQDKQFSTIVFGAKDLSGEFLWPDKFDQTFLDQQLDSFREVGQEPKYWLEYWNTLRGVPGQFSSDMFIYHRPAGWDQFITAIAMDPAIGQKRSSDYACMAVVGRDPKTGQDWVLDFWMERGATPTQLIEMFFLMGRSWKCARWGIESIAYQAALLHLAEVEMARQGYYFECEGIVHGKQRKEERIRGTLYHRYFRRRVVHAQRFPEYESQLLDFPLGKDDGPDTVAMAINLLEDFSMTAAPPELNPLADTMPPLEDVLGEAWRVAP